MCSTSKATQSDKTLQRDWEHPNNYRQERPRRRTFGVSYSWRHAALNFLFKRWLTCLSGREIPIRATISTLIRRVFRGLSLDVTRRSSPASTVSRSQSALRRVFVLKYMRECFFFFCREEICSHDGNETTAKCAFAPQLRVCELDQLCSASTGALSIGGGFIIVLR